MRDLVLSCFKRYTFKEPHFVVNLYTVVKLDRFRQSSNVFQDFANMCVCGNSTVAWTFTCNPEEEYI